MKKLFMMFFAMILIVGGVSFTAIEGKAATIASGTCGDNLTWVLTDNGVLTINGTGKMTSYGDYAPWKEYWKIIEEVVVESGVTSIGNCAFRGCSKVRKVTLPDTVTKIGEDSFFYCKALLSIEIPYGVKTIPSGAFYSCTSLEYVYLPSTVQSFGTAAFGSCSSLEYFIIPDGVRMIPRDMFAECSGLEYVQIPISVTEIDHYAFNECGNLSDIYYTGTQTQFLNINIDPDHNECITYATIHYTSEAPCSNHIYGSYSKTSEAQHSRTCSVCGYVEKSSHTWNSGEVIKVATCNETGIKTYSCTACNATKTETIAKLTSHTYDHTYDADCNICGYIRKIDTASSTTTNPSTTKPSTTVPDTTKPSVTTPVVTGGNESGNNNNTLIVVIIVAAIAVFGACGATIAVVLKKKK